MYLTLRSWKREIWPRRKIEKLKKNIINKASIELKSTHISIKIGFLRAKFPL